jgi:hypothetical protein
VYGSYTRKSGFQKTVDTLRGRISVTFEASCAERGKHKEHKYSQCRDGYRNRTHGFGLVAKLRGDAAAHDLNPHLSSDKICQVPVLLQNQLGTFFQACRRQRSRGTPSCTRSFDCISVDVDRMQRNFEPMRKRVEAWHVGSLHGGTEKYSFRCPMLAAGVEENNPGVPTRRYQLSAALRPEPKS